MEKLVKSRRLRFLLCITVLVLTAVPLVAQDQLPWWGSYYMPGNVSVGARFGFDNQDALSFFPSFEYKFSKARPANLFPIDFGVGARAGVSYTTGGVDDALRLGFGPYLSAHLGYRGCRGLGIDELRYLEPLDFFVNLGFLFNAVGSDRYGNFSLFTQSGLNYFVNDNFAVTFSYFNERAFGIDDDDLLDPRPDSRNGAKIGILLRFGPKEPLGDPPDTTIDPMPAFTFQAVYYQFVAYYYMSFALAGGFYNDESYEIGDETLHHFTFRDEDGEEGVLAFTRALLHREGDGTAWWRMEIQVIDMARDDQPEGTMPFEFEFLTNENYHLLKLRYMDPETGEIQLFEPDDPAFWEHMAESDLIYDEEAFARYFVGSESITVPAGTFETEKYQADEDEYLFTWWVGELGVVPGLLVRMEGTNKTEGLESIVGELQRINRGVTTPWGPLW